VLIALFDEHLQSRRRGVHGAAAALWTCCCDAAVRTSLVRAEGGCLGPGRVWVCTCKRMACMRAKLAQLSGPHGIRLCLWCGVGLHTQSCIMSLQPFNGA
jgi:hypothetical protein